MRQELAIIENSHSKKLKQQHSKITSSNFLHIFCNTHDSSCSVTQLHLTFVTPRTVASQVPLSMKFSRKENLSGLPFLTPRDLLSPGIRCTSLVFPALASRLLTNCSTWEALLKAVFILKFNTSLRELKTNPLMYFSILLERSLLYFFSFRKTLAQI